MQNENQTLTLPAHVKKLRLGVYTSEYHQPISLMRVMGPLLTMAKEDPRLELVLPPMDLTVPGGGQRLSWDWLMGCDAVFYLHPETDTQVHSISLAWNLGIPIWAEYVDDIFNVDQVNPGWKVRRNKTELRENVATVAAHAMVLTAVSDQNREALIAGIAPGDIAAMNMLRQKMLVLPEGCLWERTNTPRKKLISWRGLGSHAGDIEDALPHLLNVAGRFPDWEWMFSGDQEICAEFGKQLATVIDREKILIAPMWPTPFDMMMAWAGQAPYLHVVPLADTTFNKSKSHLAWLEASAVGAAVIAPDHLAEWKQPGVITYHNSKIVGGNDDALSEVLAREMIRFNDGAMHPNVEESRSAIFPAKTLKAMNQRRWAILRKLIARQPVVQVADAPLTTEEKN